MGPESSLVFFGVPQEAQERLVLEAGKLIREVFLQQSAYSENDANCSLAKTSGLLEAILAFYEEANTAVHREVPLARITALPLREELMRLKEEPNNGFVEKKDAIIEKIKQVIGGLQAK